jgi:hypothetical protein
MSINKLHRKLIGSGIALFIFAGFGFFFTTEANAQYRGNRQIWRDDRNINRGNINRGNLSRIAQSQGYNDGLREGDKDMRGRKRPNPYSKGRYKKATNGYSSRLGNKEAYKQFYRQAFVRGYNEAFSRNNRGYRRIW